MVLVNIKDRGRDFVPRCCALPAGVGAWTPSKDRRKNLRDEHQAKPFPACKQKRPAISPERPSVTAGQSMALAVGVPGLGPIDHSASSAAKNDPRRICVLGHVYQALPHFRGVPLVARRNSIDGIH